MLDESRAVCFDDPSKVRVLVLEYSGIQNLGHLLKEGWLVEVTRSYPVWKLTVPNTVVACMIPLDEFRKCTRLR